MTITFVSACGPDPVREIKVSASPVSKPTLTLPDTPELRARPVEWVVITPDNVDEKFAELRESGNSVVFFALTSDGYENVSLNLNDLRSYIQAQRKVIYAYREYYNDADRALNTANSRLSGS